VPQGKVAILTARDGAPLRSGQAFADPFPTKLGYQMLDAATFIGNGGQRGPQLTVLTPGKWRINRYLWDVAQVDAKEVKAGYVGVVKSNVNADIDFGTLKATKPTNCDVIVNKDVSAGRVELVADAGTITLGTTAIAGSGIDVFGMMDGRVDLVLDGGRCTGAGSTTVDITEPYWRMIKEGAVSEKEIAECLEAS